MPFGYFDIDEDPDAHARYRQMMEEPRTVPLVVIGETIVNGFRRSDYLRALCGEE